MRHYGRMPDADAPPDPGAVRHLWWRVRDYASVLRWQAGNPRGSVRRNTPVK